MNNGGAVMLADVDMFRNDAIRGGGIYNRNGRVEITNSIVANNHPQGIENCSGSTITDGRFNIDNGETCKFTVISQEPGLDPGG